MIDEDTTRDLLRALGAGLPVNPPPSAELRTAGRRRVRTLRAARVAGVVAGVALVLAVPMTLRSSSVPAPPTHSDVVMPPVGAGPVDVVRAYVAALDAGDIETVKALSTAEHVARTDASEDSWYRNVVSITDVRISAPISETGEGTKGEGLSEVVFVPVRFILKQRHDDGSMPDGETVWGYRLGRASAAERWLVLDEGPV
jgi:hypothetical protein